MTEGMGGWGRYWMFPSYLIQDQDNDLILPEDCRRSSVGCVVVLEEGAVRDWGGWVGGHGN